MHAALSARRHLRTDRRVCSNVRDAVAILCCRFHIALAQHLEGHCCVQSSDRARDWCHDIRLRLRICWLWFPREVISVAVRWYLRYGLSYRDVEELLAERGITVDHVTVYRWVHRFTPEFVEAARTCRHVPGNRWFVDGRVGVTP